MPGRLPNAMKGYGPGQDPKTTRSVRRIVQPRSNMPAFLRSRNPLKSRVIQSGVWFFIAGAFLVIITIIAQSQYGFSPRFKKAMVGAPLLNILWCKSIMDMLLAMYVLLIWYLSLILEAGFFNFFALYCVVDSLVSVWSIVIVIQSLVFNGTTTASLSYSSGQRTMLMFLAFLLVIFALITIGYTMGCIQMWKTERWRQRHATADFSAVVATGAGRDDDDEDSSDDDTEDDSDVERPRATATPAAPAPRHVLPTPGAAGSEPVFYKAAHPPPPEAKAEPDAPVHDETTRALFAHMWQSMKESGNFVCGVSRVPGLPEMVTHLRTYEFVPLMTGDDGRERKVYFYAEESVNGSRVMVFLAEFRFDVAAKRLSATFKSHTKTHIQKVRQFNLQKLFQVVKA